MTATEALFDRAVGLLERLVAFDTTSRLSNLELIAFTEGYLAQHGVASRRVANAEGTKANLLATIGPAIEGGIVLSGHTDVVPVDGQPWTSDPLSLVRRGERLFGRGTCDMKGFVALALAAAPDLVAADPTRPVHLAFSYDEEIGCLGARDLIRTLVADLPRPDIVIVGEPTDMQAVSGHKSIGSWTVTVTGKEAHSSQTHLGASAVMEAVALMARLADLAEQLKAGADPASPFTPPHPTLTIGTVHGGTAGNILARECRFLFDLRAPPGFDPNAALAPFFALCAEVDARLAAAWPGAGVKVAQNAFTPALAPEANGMAEAFARRLAGDNGPARAVPYAAEAGQFQEAGFSTVICGPGSIDQAHQADEYVEVAQMQRGAAFMTRLVEAVAAA